MKQQEGQPTFDPLRPLLPEEVCWILDQAMAYEVTWGLFFVFYLTFTSYADGIPWRQRSCPYCIYFALRAPSRRHKPRSCYEMAPFIPIRPSQTTCPHYGCTPYGCPGVIKMRRSIMERISKRRHVRCMCCFDLLYFELKKSTYTHRQKIGKVTNARSTFLKPFQITS